MRIFYPCDGSHACACGAICRMMHRARALRCGNLQAVVPVGKLQDRILFEFASLITAFRQATLELLSFRGSLRVLCRVCLSSCAHPLQHSV